MLQASSIRVLVWLMAAAPPEQGHHGMLAPPRPSTTSLPAASSAAASSSASSSTSPASSATKSGDGSIRLASRPRPPFPSYPSTSVRIHIRLDYFWSYPTIEVPRFCAFFIFVLLKNLAKASIASDPSLCPFLDLGVGFLWLCSESVTDPTLLLGLPTSAVSFFLVNGMHCMRDGSPFCMELAKSQ